MNARATMPVALAPLSVGRPEKAEDLFDAAVLGGFGGVGMTARTADGGWAPWARDDAALQRTHDSAVARGLGILDVGIARLEPETDFAGIRRLIRVAAALDASHVLVQGWNPDVTQSARDLARVGDLAAASGLTTALEFMPYSAVPDLPAAVRLVETVGAPAVGVLLDLFQHVRAGGTAEDIGPAGARIVLVQLSDGSASPPSRDLLRQEALTDRRYPGEGAFPLGAFLAVIPAGVPLTVETPSLAYRSRPIAEQAVALGSATRAVLRSSGRLP